jgi:hypothetical protein
MSDQPEVRQAADSRVNWTVVLVAVLAAMPPTLIALAGLVQAVRTHDLVNSRVTELVELEKRKAAVDATKIEQAAENERQLKAQLVDAVKEAARLRDKAQ